MLQIEKQNIANTGQASIPVPTGNVGANSNLPSGFGSDATGRIFRYDSSGNVNPSPASPTPTVTSSSGMGSSPAAGTPSPVAPGGSGVDVAGLGVNKVLSPDEYKAKFGVNIDENSIREQARNEVQAKIDAINLRYDDIVRGQNRVNEGNEGSTRAIGARSGLLGSTFGEAQISTQRQKGADAISAINAERGAMITAALDKLAQTTSDRIAAKKAEALQDADSYNSYLEKAQLGAKEVVKQLGGAGVSYSDLRDKSPDKLKELLESTGLSEMELALQLNAAKPPAEKIDWKTDVKGNYIITYGVNPKTGKPEYFTQELPSEAAGNEVKIVDGEIWSIGPDGKTATKIGGPGKAASEASTFTLGPGEIRYDASGNVIARGADKATTTPDKIVKVDGVDYVQNPDGSLSKPVLPDTVPSGEKVAKANDVISKIDALLANPNLAKAIGPVSSNIPEIFRSGARNDVDAAIDQLIAGIAIENLSLLKGPMSDKDVAFIKEASSGLKKNMSEEGFKSQLNTLRSKFEEIKNKAASSPSGSATAQISPQELQELRAAFPGVSDDELMRASGFNSESQTSLNGTPMIGGLSAKYESGGNPGAIGYDRTGGLSYGTYQLAHSNAQRFVEQSPYAAEFKGIPFNSQAFQNKWKEIAKRDPAGFGQSQHDFIEKTHLGPQTEKLAKLGLDSSQLSPVLNDVIWSTAVQHGPNNNIVVNAINSLPEDATEADLIKKIYDLRWSGGKNFASSTASVRNSVKNRFFGKNGELATALSRLNSSTA